MDVMDGSLEDFEDCMKHWKSWGGSAAANYVVCQQNSLVILDGLEVLWDFQRFWLLFQHDGSWEKHHFMLFQNAFIPGSDLRVQNIPV